MELSEQIIAERRAVVTNNSVGIATVEVVGQWNYILAACVNSSFPSSIHFVADFRLGPDCIKKSSLFGISLPSWNARFRHVSN